MKGDFTRFTFRPTNHYSGVRLQQGRVQLDADWNEHLDIETHRDRTTATDVIGRRGAPKFDAGFGIELIDGASDDLAILPGRIYVDGILCELEGTRHPVTPPPGGEAEDTVVLPTLRPDDRALRVGDWLDLAAVGADGDPVEARVRITALAGRRCTFEPAVPGLRTATGHTVRRLVTYRTQLDYPVDPDIDALDPARSYLVYLDVWERHLTAHDRPALREVALGGPDTATRTQTVWQVRVQEVGDGAACEDFGEDWAPDGKRSTGRLRAQAATAPAGSTPCMVPEGAGYRRLENQLYRVEIHRPEGGGNAGFKWSRDNGSVVARLRSKNPPTSALVVQPRGRDAVLDFAANQVVEIVDERATLRGDPGLLLRVVSVRGEAITVAPLAGQPAIDWDRVTAGASVRRWDGAAALETGRWIGLEEGVEIWFDAAGTFQGGDYWTIPARTATGDLEWPTDGVEPLFEPPHGIRHGYCPLAILESDGEGWREPPHDCRPLFPPLTRISADDVSYDNGNCGLVEANTVQEALDRLCEQQDLRDHNKHLHGWGIVCGLQVHCAPGQQGARNEVVVRTGYALDCDGNVLRIREDRTVDVLGGLDELRRAHPNQPILDGNGNGEVCLVLGLDEDRRVAVRLEPYVPEQNTLRSRFENTLLMDLYRNCILRLVTFFQEQTTPGPDEEDHLVGPARQRITSIANLLVLLSDPENGQYVYTSEREHDILRGIYHELREILRSQTFCAMFDNARPFPEWRDVMEARPTLSFGKGSHDRLRLHPSGGVAYTVGGDNRIHAYDLQRGEMTAEIEFPGGAGTLVRDVAFSADGTTIHAIATLSDQTMFASARIRQGSHEWGPVTIFPSVQLVTLGTWSRAQQGTSLLAVGRGTGLYTINPVGQQARLALRTGFNAVGHLVVDNAENRAFASARQAESTPDAYDRIVQINLNSNQVAGTFVLRDPEREETATLGRDDIAFSAGASRLYAVADAAGGAGKRLISFDLRPNGQGAISVVRGLEDTEIRLASHGDRGTLMVSFEESFRIGMLQPGQNQLEGFRCPVQISPISMAMTAEAGDLVVLNAVSGTVMRIPAANFSGQARIDLEGLAAYRRGVLEAFYDLFGGLLQYLKDCFCDHLLVSCPDCEPERKIYLGCVSIRSNRVERVCNFSKRKYVKTFPTMEYWLSLVPVVPLITWAIERICCSAPMLFFGGKRAPEQAVLGLAAVRPAYLRGGVRFAQQANIRARIEEWMGNLGVARALAGDWVGSQLRESSGDATTLGRTDAVVHREDVVDQPVDRVRERLEESAVATRIETYDASAGLRDILRATTTPPTVRRGDEVVLFEEEGVVRYYSIRRGGETLRAPTVGEPADAGLTARVGIPDGEAPAAMEGELERVKAELAEMRTRYDAMNAEVQSLNQLRARVERLLG